MNENEKRGYPKGYPNNKLFVCNDGTKIILYFDGPAFAVKIIEPNPFEEGTDEYNNKEIEDWEEVRKYIKNSIQVLR